MPWKVSHISIVRRWLQVISPATHTYIHNWTLQPISQDYWPSFSHHLCCVFSFYTSERKIFWEAFHGSFFLIYSQSFCQKSAEKKSPKKYFFLFCFDVWLGGSNPGYSSIKPRHYLLDHGDFLMHKTKHATHAQNSNMLDGVRR